MLPDDLDRGEAIERLVRCGHPGINTVLVVGEEGSEPCMDSEQHVHVILRIASVRDGASPSIAVEAAFAVLTQPQQHELIGR